MRLILVPLMFAVILGVGTTSVHANGNQASAEKIAASLGDRYPGYDVAVSYQNGKVRLVGQMASQEMIHSALEHIQRIPGVPVREIDNGLRVAPNPQMVRPAVPVPREVAPAMAMQHPPKAVPAAVAPKSTSCPRPEPASPVQPEQTAKVKRSIWSPNVKTPITNAPTPLPTQQPEPVKAVVVQASNRVPTPTIAPSPVAPGRTHAAPPEQAYPPQYPPQYSPQAQVMHQGMGHHHGMMPPEMQGAPMYGPPQGAAYHPEAYGPQGPMPGQYNQPNLPEYAWPSYACYPNYAEVCYPKQYSPKAWPYIGPFYPYPQAPLGWRKVTMEHHDGWWWLDFDDGAPSGPFSPLFRQPVRYTY